ncbi:MAG: hypothetical protein JNM56_16035 [Planctomycetia bacterium]|nr:hypothetical protein [Planctomycetia bacterium]
MAQPAGPLVPPGWHDMLGSVLEALGHAEREVARSLEAFETAAGQAVATAAPTAVPTLPADHLRRLETCVAQADLLTGQTDTTLQESERALRQWLELAEVIRRKLAGPAAPSV